MNNSHLFSNAFFTPEDGLIARVPDVGSISCFIRTVPHFTFPAAPLAQEYYLHFTGSKTGPETLANGSNGRQTGQGVDQESENKHMKTIYFVHFRAKRRASRCFGEMPTTWMA